MLSKLIKEREDTLKQLSKEFGWVAKEEVETLNDFIATSMTLAYELGKQHGMADPDDIERLANAFTPPITSPKTEI